MSLELILDLLEQIQSLEERQQLQMPQLVEEQQEKKEEEEEKEAVKSLINFQAMTRDCLQTLHMTKTMLKPTEFTEKWILGLK